MVLSTRSLGSWVTIEPGDIVWTPTYGPVVYAGPVTPDKIGQSVIGTVSIITMDEGPQAPNGGVHVVPTTEAGLIVSEDDRP